MSQQPGPELAQLQQRIAEALQQHWRGFLVQGIVMMVLGFIAIMVPQLSTVAVELLIGWLILFGGVFRAVTLFRSRTAPGYFWSLISALLAIVLGVILLARPAEGVLTLTMVLIALFIVEGVVAIVLALQLRDHLKTWGWAFFSGLVDLLLAYLIWNGWPSTAAWAIGLLVGLNMIFFGSSLAMIALAARKGMGNSA
ncbi:MAG TPA: HdeD family acid-resistance protein [Kiloniellaceae bacterium]|nr:HdeD family acid-resistance protein [Kiloniellaceae bacterium]